MIVILTANGYKIEREMPASATVEDAVQACAELEAQANDGYARLVSQDGRLVADAEGPWDDEGEFYTDAATATGMYDRY